MAKVRSGSVCNNPSSIINRPDELAGLQYLGRKKVEDGEIAVFGAEKYFNGVMDGESPRARSINGAMGKPARPNVAPKFRSARSPSIHSDSSWNSRSGLLQIFPRNPAQKKACDKRRGKIPLITGCLYIYIENIFGIYVRCMHPRTTFYTTIYIVYIVSL